MGAMNQACLDPPIKRSLPAYLMGYAFLLLTPQPVLATEPPQLMIEAPHSLEPQAARLRNLNPSRFLPIMDLVGLHHPGPPIRVVLAPEQSAWAKQAPSWSSAYAMGELGMIVLLPERVLSYPYESLEQVLAHEVAHVLVARSTGGRAVPRWFDEGLAMIAAHSWTVEDRARLVWAMATEEPISLDEINARFRRDRASAQQAYVLAYAFVQDLIRQTSPRLAKNVLALVAQGLPFDEALTRLTSKTPRQLEVAFWDRQSVWTRWVPVATSSVMLWLVIVLLIFYVFRKQKKRTTAIKKQWEEEETGDP